MKITSNSASQFAKVIVDNKDARGQVSNYGTIVETGGKKYVRIDGSTYNTPFISLSDTRKDERVCVEVVNHQVIVTGNMTNPSIGVNTVDEIVERIDGDIDDANDRIDDTNDLLTKWRREAEDERRRIERELTVLVNKAQEDAEEADRHAAEAAKVATDFIEFSDDGLTLGNKATEYYVRIHAGGVQICYKHPPNRIVLSEWDASKLVIGQADKTHSTMSVNSFTISVPNDSNKMVDVAKFGKINNSEFGISFQDANGVEYSKYTTTGFTIGYVETGTKINLHTTNTALQFRQNTTVLTEFAMNRIQIGSNSMRNIVIDTNGLTIRENTTNVASFTSTEIKLGQNSTSSKIKLCGDKGTILYDTVYQPSILDGSSENKVGFAIKSDTIILNATKEYSNVIDFGSGQCSGVQLYKDNAGKATAVIGAVGNNDMSYMFLGYNNAADYKCQAIDVYSHSIWLSSGRWVWLSGANNDSEPSPGFAVFGFKFMDFRQQFRYKDKSETKMRIDVDTFYIYPAGKYVGGNNTVGCTNIWMYASSWFYVNCPWVEFTGVSTFMVNSTNWLATSYSTTASLYEAQIQQSEAIVQLFENQMAQNEAIVALYESMM